MSTDNDTADAQSTENDGNEATGAQDKSSKPAVAVTKAPNVSVDRGDHAVSGSASKPDGSTEEPRADSDDSAGDTDGTEHTDNGTIDVDAVLTGEVSEADEGPRETPA